MSSPFSTHTLDNGLTLVFETIPRIRSAALGFFAQTGSRDEAPDVVGDFTFSRTHVFQGDAPGATGGNFRSMSMIWALCGMPYTWWEGTAYFHWVQSDRATDSIEILSDMMRSNLPPMSLIWRRRLFSKRLRCITTSPTRSLLTISFKRRLATHPLRDRGVLGTEDTVKSITRDLMADYHQRRYGPNNLTFVITGAFDRDEIIRAVDAQCGGWQVSDHGREQSIPTFHASNRRCATRWCGTRTYRARTPRAAIIP